MVARVSSCMCGYGHVSLPKSNLFCHTIQDPQAVDAVMQKLATYGADVQQCKVHERAGRDGMYLPTVPYTFQLKHVDRSSTLELETDFLPLLPRQDPPVGTC